MLVHSKRPDIERAALRLFVTRGVRGTTVPDIAASAGVAEGPLYSPRRGQRDPARPPFPPSAAALAGGVPPAAEAGGAAGGRRGDAREALARAPLVLVFLAARAGATPVTLREVRQGLFATCFATERDGWMVGELGRIFHTTDGGDTWERQDAGTKRPFLTVSCLDARTAWTAGKEGIVYGTSDGGVTWSEAKTGSSRHVFSIRFANRMRAHGAGDFGTMIHTEDGGRTWTVARLPPEVELAANWIRALALAPGGRGLAVGAEGLVLRLEGSTLRRLGEHERGP